MKPELLELLPDIVLFVPVAKAKSFSQAARALRMPGSTLSRRISELEARVGLQRSTAARARSSSRMPARTTSCSAARSSRLRRPRTRR